MQKNKELQDLFNNYRNLSEDQLDRLIALIVKQEKEKLGLTLPINLKIDYDELSQNSAGGDSTLDYDETTKQYHYTIRLNGNEWYKQYLLNRNQTHQNGNRTFESSLDSLYNLVARVCHEMRHAYQNEQTHIKKDLSNPEALVWLKQELVVPDENFYRESHNYSNMPREVDAFNYQYQEALAYIRNYTNIERDNPEFFAKLQDTLNRNQRENVRPLDELTFILNGEEIKVTEYFNQNMINAMRTQNISPAIIESSILRYEYNSDYSKKSFEQLMADKQKMMDGLDDKLPNYIHLIKKIDSIYNSIINNDIELQKQQENADNQQQSSYSKEDDENNQVNEQTTVDTQKLGKETLDIQKDTRTIDKVEQQMSEHMREQQENEVAQINEFGEIIRPQNAQQNFRAGMKFDISSNEYAQETLKKFTQDLENGTLEDEDSKKKDSHKVEKGDDDYVM